MIKTYFRGVNKMLKNCCASLEPHQANCLIISKELGCYLAENPLSSFGDFIVVCFVDNCELMLETCVELEFVPTQQASLNLFNNFNFYKRLVCHDGLSTSSFERLYHCLTRILFMHN